MRHYVAQILSAKHEGYCLDYHRRSRTAFWAGSIVDIVRSDKAADTPVKHSVSRLPSRNLTGFRATELFMPIATLRYQRPRSSALFRGKTSFMQEARNVGITVSGRRSS